MVKIISDGDISLKLKAATSNHKVRILAINEVDRYLRKAILILNQKCYWTRACCEAHPWRGKPLYITFEGWLDFPVPPPRIQEVEIEKLSETGKHTTVRWWDSIDFWYDLSGLRQEILKWVDALPSHCDRKDLKLDIYIDMGEGEIIPVSETL